MPLVEVPDEAGRHLHLFELRGKLYPRFAPESLESVFTFKARSEDILLCTYPKSGTHWTFEIVRLLLAGQSDGRVVEKDGTMLEEVGEAAVADMASPRNLNTHYALEDLSPEFFKQKCKMIYVTRDPRDVAASYFNHHVKFTDFYYYSDGKWSDWLPLYVEGKVDYGSWFDYTKSWEKGMKDHPDHPFLVLAYEAMKQNPLEEVRKLANFLQLDCSEEFLQTVVTMSSFDTMKKQRESSDDRVAKVMYRKGATGDWKNYFTVAQAESFNQKFEQEMAGTEAYKLYSHTAQQQADANMNSL